VHGFVRGSFSIRPLISYQVYACGVGSELRAIDLIAGLNGN